MRNTVPLRGSAYINTYIEHIARELETLETLDFEHIPSLDLLSWLYQGPYEDENGSPTSSGHDDGFF